MHYSTMDQTSYCLWTRKKPSPRPVLLNSPIAVGSAAYNESWEEQAFAEDSADHLGGCVWPPRSYTCSFCRREFRSAQALGGHMNVHRRDRARLKQASGPSDVDQNHEPVHHHRHNLMSSTSCTNVLLGTQFPTQASNPNPNPNSSRVSTCDHDLPLLSYPLSIIQGHAHMKESAQLKFFGRDITIATDDDEESFSTTRKRRRVDSVVPFVMMKKPTPIMRREEVLSLKPSSADELDLELRLGDSPKVSLKLHSPCVIEE